MSDRVVLTRELVEAIVGEVLHEVRLDNARQLDGLYARLREVEAVPFPKWASRWGWERLVELAEAAEAVTTERNQQLLREAERRARLAREPKPKARGRLVSTIHGFKEVGKPVRIGPR